MKMLALSGRKVQPRRKKFINDHRYRPLGHILLSHCIVTDPPAMAQVKKGHERVPNPMEAALRRSQVLRTPLQ